MATHNIASTPVVDTLNTTAQVFVLPPGGGLTRVPASQFARQTDVTQQISQALGTVTSSARGYAHASALGVVGNGTTNETSAMQSALNLSASQGGGIVSISGLQVLIDSGHLTIPSNVTLTGGWGAVGQNGTGNDYTAMTGSIILNPSFSIFVSRWSSIEGTVVRRKGLLPGSSLANLIANGVGKTGTAIKIGDGTTPELADMAVRNNLILGFDRAIDLNNAYRVEISGNKIDCTNGIRVQQVFDWSFIRQNECWNFLSAHTPFYGSAIKAVASTSLVSGKRRIVTSSAHGFATGWPVIVTEGLNIPEAMGIWSITVINSTTFDLQTMLTNALVGHPTGPGAATTTGAGGNVIAAYMVNLGVAYEGLNGFDWGELFQCKSWGWAVGISIGPNVNNPMLTLCGTDGYPYDGHWGEIGVRLVGAVGSGTFTACQSAGQWTALQINTVGGVGNTHIMTGCSTWGNRESVRVSNGNLYASSCSFDQATVAKIVMEPTSGALSLVNCALGGNQIDNTSGSNNLRMSAGDVLVQSRTTTFLTATGNSQATAALIPSESTTIIGGTAGMGVRLVGIPIGGILYIINSTAVTIQVYPHVGGTIGGLGTNVGASLPASSAWQLELVSPTLWVLV